MLNKVMFKKMKLVSRLYLLTGILVAMLGVNGMLANEALDEDIEVVRAIYADRLVPVQTLRKGSEILGIDVIQTVREVSQGSLHSSEGIAKLDYAIRTLVTSWQAYLKTNLAPEEVMLIEQTKPISRYAEAVANKVKAIMINEDMDALNAHRSELFSSVEALRNQYDLLIELQLVLAEKEYKQAIAASERSKDINLVILILSLVFALVVSLQVARSILRQLGGEPDEVKRVLEKVASGDLTVDIEISEKDTSNVLYMLKEMLKQHHYMIRTILSSADNLSSASQLVNSTSISLPQHNLT